MRVSLTASTRLALFSLLALVVSTGCTEPERFPPGPGGPSTGSGTPGDPGPGGGGGGVTGKLTGRLCRIVDLSRPTSCAQLTDMSAISVRVAGSTSQVLTASNGTFSLDIGQASTVTIEAGGNDPAFRRTLLLVSKEDGFTGVNVPLVDAAYVDQLVDVLSVPLAQETGIVAVYPTLADRPLDSVIIDSISFSGGIFYDAGGAFDWVEASLTSTLGAALVFGVSPGTAQLSALDTISNSVVDVGNIPVGADAVSFVSVPFD